MSEELKVIIQLISGGAFGALITTFVTYLRNRIPKIDYNFEIQPIFNSESKIGNFELRLLFYNKSDENSNVLETYKNVFALKLKMKNISSSSFQVFKFGIDLPENMRPFLCSTTPHDRMHEIKCLNEVSPKNASTISEIDFEIKPFNRNTNAEITVLFTEIGQPNELPKLVSSESVKFIDKIRINKDTKEFISEVLLTMLPFRLK